MARGLSAGGRLQWNQCQLTVKSPTPPCRQFNILSTMSTTTWQQLGLIFLMFVKLKIYSLLE